MWRVSVHFHTCSHTEPPPAPEPIPQVSPCPPQPFPTEILTGVTVGCLSVLALYPPLLTGRHGSDHIACCTRGLL
jgi:hypothetical protein